MGNCLVTKLKGVVDNDNLQKLGEIVVKVSAVENPTPDNRYLDLQGSDLTITVTNGAVLSNNQISNVDCEVHILPKYNLTNFGWGAGNSSIIVDLDSAIALLKYNNVLVNFMPQIDERMDLSVFANPACKNSLRYLGNFYGKGNIEVFAGYSELTNIPLFADPAYNGDITVALANLTKVTNVYCASSYITGSLTELAQAQVAAGRTSGTLVVGTSAYMTVDGTTQTAERNYRITFDSSLPNGYSIEQIV